MIRKIFLEIFTFRKWTQKLHDGVMQRADLKNWGEGFAARWDEFVRTRMKRPEDIQKRRKKLSETAKTSKGGMAEPRDALRYIRAYLRYQVKEVECAVGDVDESD